MSSAGQDVARDEAITDDDAAYLDDYWLQWRVVEELAQALMVDLTAEAVDEALERLRSHLNLGGALLIERRGDWTENPEVVDVLVRHAAVSAKSRRELPREPRTLRGGTGLLGEAWRQAGVWRGARGQPGWTPADDPILAALAGRLHNALVVPLGPGLYGRGAQRAGDCPPRPPLAGFLCLLNKAQARDRWGRPRGPYESFTDADHQGARLLSHLFCLVLSCERLIESSALAVVDALERRDPRNADHSRRVADAARAIGAECRNRDLRGIRGAPRLRGSRPSDPALTPALLERLRLAGYLHDIGKIGMSDAALRDDAESTDSIRRERAIHPHAGAAIVEQFRGLAPQVAEAARLHQEWIDPRGKRDYGAEEAPGLEACIIAVADAYDSMTRDRPPMRGWSRLAACTQLLRLRGRRVHGSLVDVFLRSRYLKDELRADSVLPPDPDINTGPRGALFSPREPAIQPVQFRGGTLYLVRQWLACRIVREELRLKDEVRPPATCALASVEDALRLTREGMEAEPGLRPARERARAAEMAFLWVRVPEPMRGGSPWLRIAETVCRVADRKYALPVIMDGTQPPGPVPNARPDLGVLALSGDQAVIYGLAQTLRDGLKEEFRTDPGKGAVQGIAVGVAYVPHADISGCRCLVGSALIAAAGVEPACRNAISFFDRARHADVGGRVKRNEPLGP